MRISTLVLIFSLFCTAMPSQAEAAPELKQAYIADILWKVQVEMGHRLGYTSGSLFYLEAPHLIWLKESIVATHAGDVRWQKELETDKGRKRISVYYAQLLIKNGDWVVMGR